ncbi:MAG: alpha-hydroxy-acid oxidizing protein, partial [Paracoccaceae bacterium]|nr:alpha-hydroxy-acid oxidizing protein [Paracoccaceae bacterium]
LGTARLGMPRMRLIDGYAGQLTGLSSTEHAGYMLRTSPDMEYLKALRDAWDGPLIVKGVLDARDVPMLEQAGADAIWVSNHAGRQFDGAPSTISMLPAIRGVQEDRPAQAAEKRAAEALLDGAQAPDQPEAEEKEPEETQIEVDASLTMSTQERLRTLDFEQMSL